ncbi:MAG TPA: DoxX family protein [Ornithinibacter sp.]|nr:DoxX family protein [Ornithinibacter sp.]
MNTVLWVLQIVLALAFGLAGVGKLTQPREKMQERMGWVEDFSPRTVTLIGALELLAAIGLVLPAATGILPWLTPLAALGLVVIMVLAIPVHLRRGETPMVVVNVVLALMAAFVAWQRFGPNAL